MFNERDVHEGAHMRVIRIAIADDYDPWRARVREMLQSCADWHIVAEARDGLEAVRAATELKLDVVLLDIGMPLLDGIRAAARILHVSPMTRIIFLTQQDENDIRVAALATGAAGYVLKSRAADELRPTIEAALVSVPAD